MVKDRKDDGAFVVGFEISGRVADEEVNEKEDVWWNDKSLRIDLVGVMIVKVYNAKRSKYPVKTLDFSAFVGPKCKSKPENDTYGVKSEVSKMDIDLFCVQCK